MRKCICASRAHVRGRDGRRPTRRRHHERARLRRVEGPREARPAHGRHFRRRSRGRARRVSRALLEPRVGLHAAALLAVLHVALLRAAAEAAPAVAGHDVARRTRRADGLGRRARDARGSRARLARARARQPRPRRAGLARARGAAAGRAPAPARAAHAGGLVTQAARARGRPAAAAATAAARAPAREEARARNHLEALHTRVADAVRGHRRAAGRHCSTLACEHTSHERTQPVAGVNKESR